MKLLRLITARSLTAGLLLLCEACEPVSIQRPGAPELKLSAAVTKVEDSSFETGDQIGVFMEYPEGYALDNQKYTLTASGTWVTGFQQWWKDETTPADFYCYHPYIEISNPTTASARTTISGENPTTAITTIPFSVAKDQSTHAAFSGSDILWGSNLQVKPTESTVELITKHLNGQIIIELIPGTGYDSTSLSRAIEQVHFNNVLTDAVLNLKSGEYHTSGTACDIIPQREGLTLRALLPPQSIDNALLMTITVGGLERTLTSSVEIESNIKKKCRITINKVSEGINVGIGGWEDSEEDFGGTLK